MTLVTIGLACVLNQDTGHGSRVEVRRVSPTIDEIIYKHTLKYIMERGEVEGVGERLAAVKAMAGGLNPWSHLNIKPGTISTTVWDDLIG